MTFLIKDLLDFAQMKTGKFRINIKEFNVRQAFEEVMSIQKEQAKSKGIILRVKYINISESENVLAKDQRFDKSVEMFSPVMKSDINRIQ